MTEIEKAAMGTVRDYEAMEAVLLDYIERYGLSKKARRYFVAERAKEKDVAAAGTRSPERAG